MQNSVRWLPIFGPSRRTWAIGPPVGSYKTASTMLTCYFFKKYTWVVLSWHVTKQDIRLVFPLFHILTVSIFGLYLIISRDIYLISMVNASLRCVRFWTTVSAVITSLTMTSKGFVSRLIHDNLENSSVQSVFENTYFTFSSDLKNATFYVFFWNDVSKSRKKSLAKV